MALTTARMSRMRGLPPGFAGGMYFLIHFHHDRTSAFTPPLLRGLGYLPAASCRGHRAPYSRAACLAQHAAKLVDWHVRDAYCRRSRLVVPRPDGRGEHRSYF